MNQELEVLSKMDDTFASRDEFKEHVEQLAADYLKLAQRPLSRRVARGTAIGIAIAVAYAAAVGFIFVSGHALYALLVMLFPSAAVPPTQEADTKVILGVGAFGIVGLNIIKLWERLERKAAKQQTLSDASVDE